MNSHCQTVGQVKKRESLLSSLGKTTFLLGGGHATREENLEHLHRMSCFKVFVTWLVGWLVDDTVDLLWKNRIVNHQRLFIRIVWTTKEERTVVRLHATTIMCE